MSRVSQAAVALALMAVAASPLTAQSPKPGTVAPAPAAAPAEWTQLGTLGNWQLERLGPAEAPVQCAVWMMTGQEQGLRFSHGGDTSVIAFVGLGSAATAGPIPVSYHWNGDPATGQTDAMALDDSQFWRGVSVPNTMPDGRIDLFANGRSVTFSYDGGPAGRQTLSFSLAGSSRAMLAALDCAMPGHREAPARAASASGQPHVLTGTCRLVVDGQTYVDRRGDCPIWMQNDGTGAFWINTDRATASGPFFASIEPRGDGTASGHWNAERGATHAQAFLGEDFRLGSGGCWIGARATICAAR